MTPAAEPSLAEQRQSMRGRLQEQRRRIAEHLAPAGNPRAGFPRSVTMRLLIQRPELLVRLLMPRARLGASIIAGLLVARLLSRMRSREPGSS